MSETETLGVRAVGAVASPFRPWPLKERLSEMAQRLPTRVLGAFARAGHCGLVEGA